MAKRVCLILSAVLVILFCLSYVVHRANHSAESAELRERSEAYQAALRPLWSQKSTLEADLRELNQRVRLAKQQADAATQSNSGKGSVVLILSDIDASLEATVLPEMRSHRFVGIIAVSEYYFPGENGCMSMETVHTLLEEGWTLAMTVGESTDIRAFYQRIIDSGLPKPEAVYCTASAMADRREIMGEMGLNVLFRRSESMITDDARFYFAQCVGSNDVDAPQRLSATQGTQNFLALSIGSIYDRDKCSNIAAMLNQIQQGISDDRLQIIRPSANNLQQCVVRSILVSGNEAQLSTLRTGLTQQLEEVNQEIKEAIAPGWI